MVDAYHALGIAAIYASLVVANAGALNSSTRANTSELHQSPMQAHKSLAFSVGISLFPPVWLMTPFITGFYYSGWTLTWEPFPCTSDQPKIWCQP